MYLDNDVSQSTTRQQTKSRKEKEPESKKGNEKEYVEINFNLISKE